MKTKKILFLGILLIILGISTPFFLDDSYSPYAQAEITSATNAVPPDDFLLRLVEGGHTAIFQWAAVWLASGIGVIQIIIVVLGNDKQGRFNRIIYGIIYFILILIMTLSFYSILHIMHLQNQWINRLSNETEKTWFYESRSFLSKLIVGHRANLSLCEHILILTHFGLFFIFGIVVWMKKCIVRILPCLGP